MKTIGIHAIVLSLLFILAGYYFSETIWHFWFADLPQDANLHFFNASVTGNFWLKQNTVLSLGIPPLLAYGLLGLLNVLRRITPSVKKFYAFTLLLFAGYLLGAVLKYILLHFQVKELVDHPLTPGVANVIPLEQLSYFSWAITGTFLMLFLVFILALRKK